MYSIITVSQTDLDFLFVASLYIGALFLLTITITVLTTVWFLAISQQDTADGDEGITTDIADRRTTK